MGLTILLSLGSLCVCTAPMKVDFVHLLLPRMRSIPCKYFTVVFLEKWMLTIRNSRWEIDIDDVFIDGQRLGASTIPVRAGADSNRTSALVDTVMIL